MEKAFSYMRAALQAITGCVALSLAVSCASIQARPAVTHDPAVARNLPGPIVAPLFFIPGETMQWDVRFMGVEVGRAGLAVGRPGTVDGRRVLSVIGQGEAAGLLRVAQSAHDSITSWIDLDTQTPLRTESELLLRGKHVRVEADRQPDQKVSLVVEKLHEKRTSRRTKRLPPGRVHDGLSSLLAIRGWSAEEGAQGTIVTLGGARLWRTTLTVAGRDRIEALGDKHDAIRIDGQSVRLDEQLRPDTSKRRSFTVWLSDDDQRILLRFKAKTEYGNVEMRAREHGIAAE